MRNKALPSIVAAVVFLISMSEVGLAAPDKEEGGRDQGEILPPAFDKKVMLDDLSHKNKEPVINFTADDLSYFYKDVARKENIEMGLAALPRHKEDPQFLKSMGMALVIRPFIWLPDKPIAEDKYIEAVALIGMVGVAGQESKVVCSGTVISEYAVLSAGHCACDLGDSVSIVIGSSNVRYPGGKEFKVVKKKSRISDCGEYLGGSEEKKRDILRRSGDVAIFFVNESLLANGVSPAKISTKFDFKESYYIVGYGISDSDPKPGVKRLATIQRIPCEPSMAQKYGCNPDFEFWGDGRQITGREDHSDSCSGDSGGPVFSQGQEKPVKIVGVISRAINGTTCGQGGIYVAFVGGIGEWVENSIKY